MNAPVKPQSAGKTAKDAPIKKTAARLMAVQAVYQHLHNPQAAALLVNEYLSERTAMTVEGDEGAEILALPDGAHFKKIIMGVDKAQDDLAAMIVAHLKKEGDETAKTVELLLKSILLCGAYELIYLQDIDSPIIINDYVDVAHGFYDGGESKLVNAVLDKISKTVR